MTYKFIQEDCSYCISHFCYFCICY